MGPKLILEGAMDTIEVIRQRFLPERITTLFVGESAPHSGKFFYCGQTAMTTNMKRAVELAFGKSDDFLRTFQAYGWFLDDLVPEPINQLKSSRNVGRSV
jgi:hypothetical protein